MHWSGDRATLTLTHLNKEDEGLYTLRVITKSGYETYSAYVFVRGGYTLPETTFLEILEQFALNGICCSVSFLVIERQVNSCGFFSLFFDK